jgi:alkylated DNA nucleotide flippase Atl1
VGKQGRVQIVLDRRQVVRVVLKTGVVTLHQHGKRGQPKQPRHVLHVGEHVFSGEELCAHRVLVVGHGN